MQQVVAGIILSEDKKRILLTQREGPDYEYCWCHPGGKVEPTDADNWSALRREIVEEIGVSVVDVVWFDSCTFEPPICKEPVGLTTYVCQLAPWQEGLLQPLDGTIGLGWVTPAEIYGLTTTPGLTRLRDKLKNTFQRTQL